MSGTRKAGPARGQATKLVLVVAVCLVVVAGALVARSVVSSGGDGQDARQASARSSSEASTDTGTDTGADPAASSSPSPSSSAEASISAAAATRLQAVQQLRAKAQKYSNQKRTEQPKAELNFANFNIQGASHRGNIGHRMALTVGLLRSHAVDVAALQEFAASQRSIFDSMAGGTYARYPAGGKSLDAENSVIWNKAKYDLVAGQTRPYPYFHGAIRNMPRVLLRDKQTGASFWVSSYHNPANVFGNAAGFRSTAVSRQIADNNALRKQTQAPVLVSGDMNDRAIYYCRMGGGTGMHSADGSTSSGGCRLAGGLWIDWILGTPDVTFSNYVRDRGGAARGASDHPIVVTHVVITGRPGEAMCLPGADGAVATTCPYPTGLEAPPAGSEPDAGPRSSPSASPSSGQ